MTNTGTRIRSLTRQAIRAHGGGKSSDLFNDIYIIALTVAVALGMGVGLLSYLGESMRTQQGVSSMEPIWLALSAAVALLGVTIGLAGRLGPVGLGAGHATWWLPMPVDRRGLVRPRFMLVLVGAVAIGALAGIVLSALAVATVEPAVVVSAAAATTVAVIAVTATQLRTPGPHRTPRAILFGDLLVALCPLPVLLATLTGSYPVLPTSVTWTVVAVALVGVTVLAAIVVERQLGRISGIDLRERGAVTSYAGGAVTSLDTRELGRALAAATSKDRRRRSALFGWVHGPDMAIVTADATLLARSGRSLMQLIVTALMPLTASWAGWPVWAIIISFFFGGMIAASATAEGARRAEMAPVLDALFPVSATRVRQLRLIVPAVVTTAWALVVIGLGWSWEAPVEWPVLALVAGPIFGAGAVRSAYRQSVDWSKPLVHTPMGPPIPPGAFSGFSTGPDIVVLGGLPLWLAVGALGPTSTIVLVQMVTTLIALAIAARAKKET